MLFLRFLCLLAFSYLENVAYTGMPSLVTLGNQLSTEPCVGILDRKGLIAARNRELDRFLGKPASPTFLKAMSIGLPREFVDAPFRRARLLAFGGGAAVLALSLLSGLWMARTIRRPVSGGRLCCFSNADKISGPRPIANT